MELQLRTLTPLHVSDGSQLHSFDYVLHSGRFYRISQQQLYQFIESADANKPEQPTALAFAKWANDMATQIENVERDRRNAGRQGGRDYNQELSRLRSQYNLLSFAKIVGQEREFLDFLNQKSNMVRALPLLMEGGRPRQEIRGFQRDGLGRAYLPGSSIKGCIRTALLYHYLTEHADTKEIGDLLKKQVEKIKSDRDEAEKRKMRFSIDKYKKAFGESVEHLAFNAEMVTERKQRRFSEAQNDLMRCLLVSDVTLPDEGIGVDNIDLYLVKKLPKGQGTQAQRQTQSPAIEALMPNQRLSFHLEFNLDLLLQLHHADKTVEEDGIKVGQEIHFIGWRKRAAWLFGLQTNDFDSIPKGTKPNDPRYKSLVDKALAHILACVQRFSDAQAMAYVNWQENYRKKENQNDADAKNNAANVGAGAGSIHVEGLRFHLGFATGFEGMTEVLYLLANHKRLFSDIMELFGIGDSPSAWKTRRPGETYRANPDQFPKSRRLVTRTGIALPLGWLALADAKAQPPVGGFSTTADLSPAPVAPTYLRGTLKIGAEVNAELLNEGNPGKFKLFIRQDYEPTIELKYAAGFKPEDIGRIALLRIKNIRGKEEVLAVEFLRFK